MIPIRSPWIHTQRTLVLTLLLSLVLVPILVACDPAPTRSQTADTVATGAFCHAGLATQDTLHIVTTTGQIGNTVRMIVGLDTIDPTLWSRSAIASRTVWTPEAGGNTQTVVASAGIIQATGLDIQVSVLLGPGSDPHLYLPTFRDATLLNEADLIIYNGLHLEAQMLNALQELATTRCVVAIGDVLYANQALASLFLYDENGLVDPHIWNSPTLWREAVNTLTQVLDGMYHDAQPSLHHNAAVVTTFLDRAEGIIQDMFGSEAIPVKYLVTAHDAFGYYSALTGLETVGLQGLSTETEVSAYDIQTIADMIVEQRIPALFVETSVSEDAIEAVQAAVQAKGWQVELGGELYSDALGPVGSEGESYLGMLQHNTLTIFQALASERASQP